MMKTILGISPGTRIMGIAFAQNGIVHEWQLKSFKGKWSNKKLKIILQTVEKIILTNNVGTIAIKFPHPSRSSIGVENVCEEIKALAEKHSVAIFIYSHKDLRNQKYSPKHTAVREVQKLNEAAACAIKGSFGKGY